MEMATELLTGAQTLDGLERLATVEHALVVEYLSVCYALGHDLEAGEGGATTSQGRDTANAASALAVGDMLHLKQISTVLVAAGRSAELGRATSIPSGSADIPLAPPTATQLQHVLERERDSLGDLSPHDYLRATRQGALDSFERRLLDVSDRIYALTLALLRDRFAPKSLMGPGLAVSAMESLHDVNRVLVQRGLLPPFTLP